LTNPISLELNDPLESLLYALRAPETKRKYPQRLKFFFDTLFPKMNLKYYLSRKINKQQVPISA